MADPSVKIILTAVDKASKVIYDTKKSMDGLDGTTRNLISGITQFGTGMGVGIGIATAFGTAVKNLADETTAYNKQVREMTEVTGLGAEEISRIIQVGDDWGVSIESLRTSLGYMNKMGVTPSIDNLAKLADEYVNSSDKAAFAEKAAKLLGRGYQTLIPLLAKGGSALREQTAAIEEGLIATEEGIRASEEYRMAVDQLGDSWLVFSRTLGTKAIPQLTHLLNFLNRLSEIQGTRADRQAAYWKQFGDGIRNTYYATKDLDMILPQTDADIASVGQSIYITADNMERLEREAMNAGEGIERIGKSAAEAEPEVKGLLDGIDRDIASPISNFIKDLKWYMAGGGRIEKAFQDLLLLAPEMDPAAVEDAAAELLIAATDLEMTLDPNYVDQGAQLLEDTLGAAAAKVAMEDIQGSQGIAGALERVTEVERKLVFRFVYLGTPPPGWGGGGWEGELANPPVDIPGRASGGGVRANRAYVIGEEGPELFVPNTAGNIVPNNQLGGNVYNFSFGDIVAPAGVDARAVAALVFRELQTKSIAATRSGAYAAGG